MAPAARRIDDPTPREDHFVHIHGATWADYERLLAMRGEHAVPRITYLQGTLEIMSPSQDHEIIKSCIGRLVEVYCDVHDIDFTTVGSWTLKRKKDEAGAEPDECYVFGAIAGHRVPDLAIEVGGATSQVMRAHRKALR